MRTNRDDDDKEDDDDRPKQGSVAVGSLGYAMSFARGTRYDSPLRLCRDHKNARGRMPDRLPYVSTIDSNSPDGFRFLRLPVGRRF